MKYIFSIFILVVIASCSAINKPFVNDELIVYDIKDEFLLSSIDTYKEEVFLEKEEADDVWKKKANGNLQ